MTLHPTINVSFPRSGHHMLRDILRHYFGDDLKYCKWSDDFEQRPGVCDETNFTMVHDLHLTFPVHSVFKYLVLFRHPLYSLASWRIHMKRSVGDICEDQEITKQKLEFWAKWMNKWVLSPIPNRMIVTYEKILSNPHYVVSRVINFMSDDSVDMAKLSNAIDAVRPRDIPNTTKEWIGYV